MGNVLTDEGGITDPIVIAAAVLHDTLEDTETSEAELRQAFGEDITQVVCEVSGRQERCPRPNASAFRSNTRRI